MAEALLLQNLCIKQIESDFLLEAYLPVKAKKIRIFWQLYPTSRECYNLVKNLKKNLHT